MRWASASARLQARVVRRRDLRAKLLGALRHVSRRAADRAADDHPANTGGSEQQRAHHGAKLGGGHLLHRLGRLGAHVLVGVDTLLLGLLLLLHPLRHRGGHRSLCLEPALARGGRRRALRLRTSGVPLLRLLHPRLGAGRELLRADRRGARRAREPVPEGVER